MQPLTLRRQVMLQALKQHLPPSELITAGDYLGQACIVLWLCSHNKKEIDDLCRNSAPISVIFDWADENIPAGKRKQAISLALDIWEDANAEGVISKSEGSTPGKSESRE